MRHSLDELDSLIAGEPLACRGEHGLGEVDTDANDLGTIAFEKREQAVVSRPEVEDTASVLGMCSSRTLSLGAVGKPI